MKTRNLALTIICLTMAVACHSDPPIVVPPAQRKGPDMKEHLINANRTVAQSEETAIDEYIARRQWPMEKLTDGARLWIYQSGKGAKVEMEDSVRVIYSIEAINGKRIYDNVEERYVAGRRSEMTGLDAAVLQMRRGDRARVILPSNLGYGIGGDGDRIPQSAILVVDLRVED